ncbi:hypothetical protein GQR58_017840 [Nymphon striatum]|nr:hypothetical protein GQR58_017840 [Nymphon striatum]
MVFVAWQVYFADSVAVDRQLRVRKRWILQEYLKWSDFFVGGPRKSGSKISQIDKISVRTKSAIAIFFCVTVWAPVNMISGIEFNEIQTTPRVILTPKQEEKWVIKTDVMISISSFEYMFHSIKFPSKTPTIVLEQRRPCIFPLCWGACRNFIYRSISIPREQKCSTHQYVLDPKNKILDHTKSI